MLADIKDDGHSGLMVSGADRARMTNFLQKMAPLLTEPTVAVVNRSIIRVGWTVPHGGMPQATGFWWPMMLSAWMAVDRTINPDDVIEIRFKERP
jgi:hypothetical protein